MFLYGRKIKPSFSWTVMAFCTWNWSNWEFVGNKYLLILKVYRESEAHLYRLRQRRSRCHFPGKLASQNPQGGSLGNKWNGPRGQQNTLTRTWFHEQGLPGRGRWWVLWEKEKGNKRKAGHMWNKPSNILWHSLPEDIHVSLGSAETSWEKIVQCLIYSHRAKEQPFLWVRSVPALRCYAMYRALEGMMYNTLIVYNYIT